MKEIQDIVHAYDVAQAAGRQTALATVVQVEGSSYRRPGARMLITEDGCITGAISGGCLEGDALRKARLAMTTKENMLVTYDTSDEDDTALGVQLGCNGIVHILIEPVDAASSVNPVSLLRQVALQKQDAVIATVFSLHHRNAPQIGTSLVLLQNETLIGNVNGEPVSNALVADATTVMATRSSGFFTYQHEGRLLTGFVQFIKPAVSLVIVGAGNDVMPLVQVANILGWEVTVVDGRPFYASRERFPSVKKVLVAKSQAILSNITVHDTTVFTLMTHNYNYDLAVLKALANTDTPYVGILGPKKKLERMLFDLAQSGITLTYEQLQTIYGPIGLDIGAETSEEIAISIVAEIKSVLCNKNGSSLKNKKIAIHAA